MAKYLAQMVMLGAQVVGRAFSRALKQEFAASQSAANQRRTNNATNESATSARLGMSVQEAMQILNVDTSKMDELNREIVEKNFSHLFEVNDKAKGGSFYLQSKKCVQTWKLMDSLPIRGNAFQSLSSIRGNQSIPSSYVPIVMQSNGLHTTQANDVFEEALSEHNIQNCINILNSIKISRPKKAFSVRKSTRNAAVLVPLCRNKAGDPSVLLTLRSSNLSSHKGEICFPGGIEDDNDNSHMISTAIRETVEELGVDDHRIKVYDVLTSFPSISGSMVHPVLGFIDLKDVDINAKINKEEVEQVFIVPLKQLCREANWGSTKWKAGWTTPIYLDKSGDMPRVWGLTAGILYAVLAALLPNVFKFDAKILNFSRR